jgi:subtilisin family serine protease
MRSTSNDLRVQQFVLLPPRGTIAQDAPTDLAMRSFLRFQLGAVKPAGLESARGARGPTLRLLDSIQENGAKLVAMSASSATQLRAQQPGLRIVPVTWFQTQDFREAALRRPARVGAARARATVALRVVTAGAREPLAGVRVVAFTDFATRAGVEGTTSAKGEVRLEVGGASKRVERLYLYPARGAWPTLRKNVLLKTGLTLELRALDLAVPDVLRALYAPPAALDAGRGVTVGVIDTGIGPHPDLSVAGGANLVQGERADDWQDNGDLHGTHVAGIIAARGTAPQGVRGLAPGVTLRSYRVFGKGAGGASNFAIAKAIDTAIRDGCDLLNLSLGGGPPDELTRSALTDAHQAGVVALIATGNDGRKPVSYPAAFPLPLAVTAMGHLGTYPADSVSADARARPYGTDPRDFLAAFSNVGPEVDLTAPGVGVVSTVPGGYAVMDGTSMACPAATGRAACALAQQPAILRLPRDGQRADAIARLILTAARPRGLGVDFEGQGML